MLKKLTAEQFDKFSVTYPLTSFYQSSSWGRLKTFNGWNYQFYGWEENNKLVAATLLLDKVFLHAFHIFYAPRGLLVDYHDHKQVNDFTKELVSEIKRQGGIELKIDPYLEKRRLDNNGKAVENGVNNFSVIQTLCDAGYQYRVDKFGNPQTTLMHTIYVLDVDGKDKTALFKACSSTVRRHIRKGESFLQLEELTKEELPRFKNILEDTASRKGFTDRNISYYQNMYDCFVPEKRLKFYVVKLDIKKYLTTSQRQLQQEQKRYENLSSLETTDDATLAAQKQKVDSAIKRVDKAEKLEEAYGDLADISAGCFFYWGHEILNLYAGNLSEFMKFEGQYYLYWELIEQTVDQGYKLFNFYGIPNNVSDPDLDVHGVYEAKKNFNGRVEELLGEFDYVISPFKHQLYQFCSTTYFRIQQMMHKSA